MPAEENTHIYVDLDIINNDQRADVGPPQPVSYTHLTLPTKA